MANTKRLTGALPDEVSATLRRLGEDIRVARRRRGISAKELAERTMVSRPTVVKLEKGDPTVSVGVLVTALWALGMGGGLREIAAPEKDSVGLQAELRRLRGRGASDAGAVDDDF